MPGWLDRTIAALAAWLPEQLSRRLVGALGTAAYLTLGRTAHRRTWRIIEAALRESPEEARRVSGGHFRRLCSFRRDYWYLATRSRWRVARLADRVACPQSAIALLERLASDGAPLVLVTIHAGGTLRGLLALVRAWAGRPGISIVKQRELTPPDERVYRHFESCDAELNVIPLSRSAGLRAAAALRAGHALCIALDWPPSARQRQVKVRFLGGDAYLCAGPARLALGSGATLVPAALCKVRGGGEALRLEEPIAARVRPGEDRNAAVVRITQELARRAERWIRAEPADWLLWPALPRLRSVPTSRPTDRPAPRGA